MYFSAGTGVLEGRVSPKRFLLVPSPNPHAMLSDYRVVVPCHAFDCRSTLFFVKYQLLVFFRPAPAGLTLVKVVIVVRILLYYHWINGVRVHE